MEQSLTPLELAVLRAVAAHHWPSFKLEGIEVTKRENTGGGRFTYLSDRHRQSLSDGGYSAGSHFIEMEGVPYGLSFVVDVSNHRINYIELVVIGDGSWDGEERSWRLA